MMMTMVIMGRLPGTTASRRLGQHTARWFASGFRMLRYGRSNRPLLHRKTHVATLCGQCLARGCRTRLLVARGSVRYLTLSCPPRRSVFTFNFSVLGMHQYIQSKCNSFNRGMARSAGTNPTTDARNRVVVNNGAGNADCFDYQSDTSKSLARQKAIGLHSHVVAQQKNFKNWLTKTPSRNAVATQTVFEYFNNVFLPLLLRCQLSSC